MLGRGVSQLFDDSPSLTRRDWTHVQAAMLRAMIAKIDAAAAKGRRDGRNLLANLRVAVKD